MKITSEFLKQSLQSFFEQFVHAIEEGNWQQLENSLKERESLFSRLLNQADENEKQVITEFLSTLQYLDNHCISLIQTKKTTLSNEVRLLLTQKKMLNAYSHDV